MRHMALTALFAFTAASAIHAGEAEECVSIPSAGARLECYDRAMGAGHRLPDQRIGRWRIVDQKTELDVAPRIAARLESFESLSCRYGADAPLSLQVRCDGWVPKIYFAAACEIADRDKRWVRPPVKFGDDAPTSIALDLSSDVTAAGKFKKAEVKALAEQLAAVDEFRIQFTPRGMVPQVATFDLRGMAAAVAPVAEACDWALGAQE